MKTQSIKEIIFEMIKLLQIVSMEEWAFALIHVHDEIRLDPIHTKVKIISMFGGSGSLNDIVLHKNGQALIHENSEFDRLRSALYSACHDWKP